MANNRITTHTLYGGVSRQAPAQRFANQAEAADNVVFSIARGAEMRSGSQTLFAVAGLTPAGNYRVHDIDRDGTEQYLVTYGEGDIRVFTPAGVECDVLVTADAQTYLDTSTPTADELRMTTVADYTIITNILAETSASESADYTLAGKYPDFDVMVSNRPARNTYWRTTNDSIGHPKGYFKYDAGPSTYATMKCMEVGGIWAKVGTYMATLREVGGFKVGMDKLVLSKAGVLWHYAAKTLYCNNAFVAGYVYEATDKLRVTGGTTTGGSVTPGWYAIASKVSTDFLTMTEDIDALNSYDLTADVAGLPLTFTDGIYASLAKTLTSADTFTNYTYQSGDKLCVTGGTGPTPGWFTIASKTNNSQLVMTTAIHTSNVYDVAGDCAGKQLTFSDGVWDQSELTLTNAAFTTYNWKAGDEIYISGGTAITPGWYVVVSHATSSATIVLGSEIGPVDQTDVSATTIGTKLTTLTAGAYNTAAKSIIKAAAFTGFTKQTGDKIQLTAGTGITPAWYTVAASIDVNCATITTSPGAGCADLAATAVGYPLTIAAAAWTVDAASVVKVDAFADYEYEADDQLYVTGGTSVTAGWYVVAAKIDDSCVTLSTNPRTAPVENMTLQGIGHVYEVKVDFTDITLTDMYDVAEQFQVALQDAGAADALISWTRTKAGRGRFTIYSQFYGDGASLSPCVAPATGFNYAANNLPFSGYAGDYTITQGTGDPNATMKTVLDSWTPVAGPAEAEAHIEPTTMPVKMTREHAGGTYGTTYRDVIMDDEPWGYWRLGEASGTVAVDEMDSHPGTYLWDGNAPIYGVEGALPEDDDTAVTLDDYEGNNIMVASPKSLMTNMADGFTYECWYKSDGGREDSDWLFDWRSDGPLAGTSMYIFGEISHSNYLVDTSQIYFWVNPPEPTSAALPQAAYFSVDDLNLQDGEWHHIIISWDGGDLSNTDSCRIYVDGIDKTDDMSSGTYEDATGNTGENIANYSSNAEYQPWPFAIVGYGGSKELEAMGGITASVDEVAIYQHALAPLRARLHYYAGHSVGDPPVFAIDVIDWNDRTSGDEVTNPLTDLIKNHGTIQSAYFHRNRFGISGSENTILSVAGDFWNFFIEDADNLGDADPIDAALTSNQVTLVDYVLPFRKSLLFFTQAGRQFELNAPEALTPTTAAITPSTDYLSMKGVQPVAVGNQAYFMANGPDTSQLMEYFYSDSQTSNTAADVSSHAEGYLPDTVRRLDACVNYGMVLCLSGAKDIIHVYRSHWSGNEKVQSAHSRWTFSDDQTIHDLAVIGNDAYLLVENAGGFFFSKLPIPADEVTDLDCTLHLDDRIEIASGTFATTKTTWTAPVTDAAIDTVVLSEAWGATAGTVYAATCVGKVITVTSATNLSAHKVYAGVGFKMGLTLSRPYLRDGDGAAVLDSSMSLHKAVLNHYSTGDYDVVIAQPNRADRTMHATFDGLISTEGSEQFFITANADNCTVTITNAGPYPVQINSVEFITTVTPRST